ncbi:MAG: DUF1668 domain-containing protein [Pirellulales bacterium]|nr:DUF1668 domain-containing protein [Pirellulales bacterium]
MKTFTLLLVALASWPSAARAAEIAKTDDSFITYAQLPVGITSFGAAIVGDALYTYGGHRGRAHNYFIEDQSGDLRRLKLVDGAKWEELPGGPRLQGLAMVGHEGKLYRIGGFTAHNHSGEEADLRSVSDVARFDPKTNKWEKLPPLPEPRSSHDAVVHDNKIYVVGGWQLRGKDSKPEWHQSAYVLDLAQNELKWQSLPKPPFQRRALSVGAQGDRIFVVGGITREDGITTKVAVFDPASGKWSAAANIPGEGLDGFGTSAFAANGRLFVTNMSGKVLGLSPDADTWVEVTPMREKRFFHRMVTTADQQLLIVGGAKGRNSKAMAVYSIPTTKK